MSRPSLDESCTKIVATVGPASWSTENLVDLIHAGVDVFRINTAHGSRDDHQRTLANIRAASQQTGFPAGVLLDLAGPKIRLGTLLVDPFRCEPGMEVSFVRGETSGDSTELTSSYEPLVDELQAGNRVMLADGKVELRVNEVSGDRATCTVVAGGEIRSRQGINLPGVKLSVSAMLPRDIDNAIWAAQNDIDFVSLSFVRTAEEIRALKELLQEHGSRALVIAKIEKPEALANLDAIVDATDGVMVARGDLGVEIDVAETPVIQKRIIRVCAEKMKPVIVATQMLESMHHNTRPTRAETSDVANAILDGTDACMLSGETAIGDHPVKAVQMMNRIMLCTEPDLKHRAQRLSSDRVHPITAAATNSGIDIAEAIRAKLIVIATRSGATAQVKSNSRSLIATLGASDDVDTLRRMNLFWGIRPILASQLEDTPQFLGEVCDWGKQHGYLQTGDQVVLVTGSGVIEKAHTVVIVHTVE